MIPRRRRFARAAAVATAALVAVSLMGCTSSTGPTSPSAPTPTPTATAVRPGEAVDVAVDDGTLRLVLASVDVVPSCPGRGVPTQVPAFAHFVVLEVRAFLDPDDATGSAYAPLGAETFRITSPDGELQAFSNTEASWECYQDEELLPPFVDAGVEVSGKVVLDSMTEHGTVAYAPGLPAGWHWSF